MDATQPPQFHYELGTRLRPLRDEGIFMMGSGDIVHNLRTLVRGAAPVEPFDWATRFESQVRRHIEKGEHAPLIDFRSFGRDSMLSAPTPEHYLPLLYVLGASFENEPVTFPAEGMDGGSISMLSVRFG
jgi:4,5-DOPA dioxygenase extradiol